MTENERSLRVSAESSRASLVSTADRMREEHAVVQKQREEQVCIIRELRSRLSNAEDAVSSQQSTAMQLRGRVTELETSLDNANIALNDAQRAVVAVPSGGPGGSCQRCPLLEKQIVGLREVIERIKTEYDERTNLAMNNANERNLALEKLRIAQMERIALDAKLAEANAALAKPAEAGDSERLAAATTELTVLRTQLDQVTQERETSSARKW